MGNSSGQTHGIDDTGSIGRSTDTLTGNSTGQVYSVVTKISTQARSFHPGQLLSQLGGLGRTFGCFIFISINLSNRRRSAGIVITYHRHIIHAVIGHCHTDAYRCCSAGHRNPAGHIGNNGVVISLQVDSTIVTLSYLIIVFGISLISGQGRLIINADDAGAITA